LSPDPGAVSPAEIGPARGPGERFHSLALGQDQIAKVEATRNELRIKIVGKNGAIVENLTIKSRR
jgi:hypothetical protein